MRARAFSTMAASLVLGSCASISEGVVTAIIKNNGEKQDLRKCEVTGSAFNGIRQGMQTDKPKVTKVLVVHGIQKHFPGYSTRFKDKITYELGLDKTSGQHKEIMITREDMRDENGEYENLGVLRISRHLNAERSQELLYYELTWSEIADAGRDSLSFDSSGEYSFQRAEMNQMIKAFVNKTIPDLLAYRGTGQKKINNAVAEASCWIFAGGWSDLPDEGRHICNIKNKEMVDNILKEQHFFVTHSLGSRIVIDTISQTVNVSENLAPKSDIARHLFETLKKKNINVFMLSNQLPLLQIGRDAPEIVGQSEQYCTADKKDYDKRIFEKLNLVAFSDPNDILSYPIPPNYADKHLDSRLCPNIINVNLNITHNKDVFGLNFANPAEAHSGYLEDDRVVGLIADGLSSSNTHPLVKEKCRWIETIE